MRTAKSAEEVVCTTPAGRNGTTVGPAARGRDRAGPGNRPGPRVRSNHAAGGRGARTAIISSQPASCTSHPHKVTWSRASMYKATRPRVASMVPGCQPRGPPPGCPPPAAYILDPPCRRSGSASAAATSDSWAAATRCRRSRDPSRIPPGRPTEAECRSTRLGAVQDQAPSDRHILRDQPDDLASYLRVEEADAAPAASRGRRRSGPPPRRPASGASSWRSLDCGAAIDMDGSLVGPHGGGPDRGYRRPPTWRLPRACPGRTTRPGTCSNSRLPARASRGRPPRSPRGSATCRARAWPPRAR